MKYIVSFLIVASSLLLACESETSSQDVTCGDPSLHLREISFVLDGVSYHSDSLSSEGGSVTVFDRSGPYTELSFEKLGVPGISSILNFNLDVVWPNFSTGIHPWGDGSADTNAFGCYIDIDSALGTDMGYTPVSGNTNIIIYKSASDDLDSVFGTFCGTMKDRSGAIVEVTDGKFFYLGYH